MGNFRGARPPLGDRGVPVHAIDDQIYSIFGVELVVLNHVVGVDSRKVIALKVEVGSFRIKVGVGDTDDDLAVPTETDVASGNQSIQIIPGDGILYFSRNDNMSIQGEGASDILTYWLLP